MSQTGQGSPWVTTTDGTNNAIVWVVGAQGDQRLHGYNGDTGAVVYAGGGANELMTGTRKWNSGIVARGSIYVANDNKVYAFRVPGRNAYSYSYSIGYTDSDCYGYATATATATQQRLLPPRYSDCYSNSYATLQLQLQCDTSPRRPQQLRRQARHRLRQPRQLRRPRQL